MRFDPEKHHRQSLRIKNRDYSRNGYYFVTLCARNRENIFADFCVGAGLAPAPNCSDTQTKGHPRGVPLHKEIIPTLTLTTIGRIIEKNWKKIAKGNIKTDAFVIMPNHIHGIVIIKPHALGVGAGLAPAPNVGSIIGAFKSRSALEYLKFIDANNLNKSAKIWQRNYYEHVIRDQNELTAIRNYIKSNPANWAKDEENLLNL
jgi:REP element-mobilizing transposase RayT